MSYFPIIRFISRCIRHISLPVSAVVRIAAERNRPFQNFVVMPPARLYVWCEMKVFLMIQGSDSKFIPPPKRDMIRLGANLIGEATMLILFSMFMLMEYNIIKKNTKTKEDEIVVEMEYLKEAVREEAFKEERQRVEVRKLRRAISEMKRNEIGNTQNN